MFGIIKERHPLCFQPDCITDSESLSTLLTSYVTLMWRDYSKSSWHIAFIFCIYAWYIKRKTPIVFQPDCISDSEVMNALLISYVIQYLEQFFIYWFHLEVIFAVCGTVGHMWRHQRKGTLWRKKYHRPWSDAAHDARRLIRAYDICR